MLSKDALIQSLIKDGYLRTPSFIEAFQTIDRADFVPEDLKGEAYINYPLPIGFGQTISQPLTVAFMLELLEPRSGEKILDVGSGSGWQTALLSFVVGDSGKVVAIERLSRLVAMANANIRKYSYIDKGTASVIEGDGSWGYEKEAPFDRIIAAAAAIQIPQAWKEQLKIGGRIVAPVRNSICVLDKTGKDTFSEKSYFGFNFVPLIVDKERA